MEKETLWQRAKENDQAELREKLLVFVKKTLRSSKSIGDEAGVSPITVRNFVRGAAARWQTFEKLKAFVNKYV